MKMIITLFLLFIAVTCLFASKEKDAFKVQKNMPFSKGVNLSGWLEGYNNSNWQSDLYSKQDFEDIKSLGVDIVRIPIFFEEFSSGAPDYIVEEWLWEKIDKAIKWCTELKLYMIIDFHNDCGDTKTRPDIEKVLLKIWAQIATRYKNSGEYILYEIYNEPHMKSGNISSDVSKWNKIQGNVLKKIREIDKIHTIIVGAEDWNSVTQLLKLPDYKDNNIILNFHDYSPYLYTHQGTSWTELKNLTHIPFPYSKEKMPPLPANTVSWVKSLYNNYENDSSEETLVKPLDDAVKFANKRGVALMCNEYGVCMTYAENSERCNWYKLKTKWMEERNIIHLSWDYRNKNGIFTNDSLIPTEARFPEDLNTELLKSMNLNIPPIKSRSRQSWFKNSTKTGNYTIYKNGPANGVYVNCEINGFRINNQNANNNEKSIYISNAAPWSVVQFLFGEICDLSTLLKSNKTVEFEIRSNQKNLDLHLYFADKENKEIGKKGLPWRCSTSINKDRIPSDGKWHKVSIPLKSFADSGAWSDSEQKNYSAEGLFSWKRIDRLVFSFGENGLQSDISIRSVVIK